MQVYLDYNATCPPLKEVIDEIVNCHKIAYANPSASHELGKRAREIVENARKEISYFLYAKRPHKIIFTASTTEANNLAILGFAFSNAKKGNHIISQPTEHESVLEPLFFLKKNGFEISFVNIFSDGRIDTDDLKKKIKKNTILITIQHANNESGVIQPIEEAVKIAKEYDIVFHTDAAQSCGKIEVSLEKLDVDMLSFSAHKLYGPKGIGALYIKNGIEIQPIILGGGHQWGLRSGTEDAAACAGFAKACQIMKNFPYVKNIQPKRDYFFEKLKEIFGNDLILHGKNLNNLLPNTLYLTFKEIEADYLQKKLSKKGIFVSTGSACLTHRKTRSSHVILAMYKRPPKEGAIRFSLGVFTTGQELDYTLSVLASIRAQGR